MKRWLTFLLRYTVDPFRKWSALRQSGCYFACTISRWEMKIICRLANRWRCYVCSCSSATELELCAFQSTCHPCRLLRSRGKSLWQASVASSPGWRQISGDRRLASWFASASCKLARFLRCPTSRRRYAAGERRTVPLFIEPSQLVSSSLSFDGYFCYLAFKNRKEVGAWSKCSQSSQWKPQTSAIKSLVWFPPTEGA